PRARQGEMERKAGVALRVTTVPVVYEGEQVAPQLIPPSLEVTVPPRMPVLLTERVKRCRVKLAVTDLVPFMVTVQVVPETASQPLQPVKMEPEAGVAVRTTVLPLVYEAEQVVPQVILPSSEVTVPLPLPVLLTVRVLVAMAVLFISTETVPGK